MKLGPVAQEMSFKEKFTHRPTDKDRSQEPTLSLRLGWAKTRESKYASDLRGLYLTHANTGDHKDFLETETVEQLHNPSYSPDLSPFNFFWFTLLISILSRRWH